MKVYYFSRSQAIDQVILGLNFSKGDLSQTSGSLFNHVVSQAPEQETCGSSITEIFYDVNGQASVRNSLSISDDAVRQRGGFICLSNPPHHHHLSVHLHVLKLPTAWIYLTPDCFIDRSLQKEYFVLCSCLLLVAVKLYFLVEKHNTKIKT